MFEELETPKDFQALRISVASPEQIRGWSYGEVTKPETINYRTFRSEKDGLFDERIFGPTKDYECYCGKYKKARFKGIICDKCGVEVTTKKVRRERMGHINLAAPVAHIWFFRNIPSIMSTLLGVSPRSLEQVVYFSRFLVINVDKERKNEALKKLEEDFRASKKDLEEMYRLELKKVSPAEQALKKQKFASQLGLLQDQEALGKILLKGIKRSSLISEAEYEAFSPYIREFCEVGMGAEAVQKALALLDLEKISLSLRKRIADSKGAEGAIKYTKRLRVVDSLRNAGISPTWMVLTVLPVIPPDLRPMVQLEGGRFATSDLNDLYRAVVNRNNRLKRLLELGAPEVIIRNEKRMLQEAVDALIDAGKARRGRPTRGRKELRSFSDVLSGKQGRFRQNLLGKRVDYSGRSVIVVGPKLKLWECGLPKEMALELFKPFVLREILLGGYAPNLKLGKAFLDEKNEVVWDILEKVVISHPVLLNRAPSLHRLSIAAFYPKLTSLSAIQIHPGVCVGFNADFDGDAMAVHIPLSAQALQESDQLMLASRNLLKPSTGEPVIYPSREMVLGLYHLTSLSFKESNKESKEVFSDEEGALLAYELGGIELRQRIKARVGGEVLETSVGRIIFNQALPQTLRFVNEPVVSSVAKDLLAQCQSLLGGEEAVKVIDNFKDLGFKYATFSGISLSYEDAKTPPEKEKILQESEEKMEEVERSFRRGLITDRERKDLTRNIWTVATNRLDDLAWEALESENPIRVVIDSGSGLGSREQVKQIAGMKGPVVDPLGRFVELPIRSNFKEGLTGFEYFAGARGARKGLVDTALRTADAGYLTRRLVDVAQDVLIREGDCGTGLGIPIFATEETLLASFSEKLEGRVLAQDVRYRNKVLAKRGVLLDHKLSEGISQKGITQVLVRSPLTCESLYGVCAACYGSDLTKKALVEMGVPVGIIAAQSIGEPGTQLTLRTKHAGGILGKDITQGLPRVEELFEARTPKFSALMAEFDGIAQILGGEPKKIAVKGEENSAEYEVPGGVGILVEGGKMVGAGEKLTDGDLDPKKIYKVSGSQAAQKYIVNEIQKAYSSQGVALNDKHIEVIVRQMFSRLIMKAGGDTTFIPGEIVTRAVFVEENAKLSKGAQKAVAEPALLGVTKAALKTDSFLAAASFMETTRVLTEAAISGKVEKLLGLKENVIIGRLIPTGARVRLLENAPKKKKS